MPIIYTNGINIQYQVQGSGQPLLLIPGVGYGGWFWRKIAPGLAESFQVITYDLRGVGGSDKAPGPYTVSLLAADAAGLLEALHIPQAAVLGHSLGGFVAQELIVTCPELVSKLILASTNHGGQKVIPITAEALQVLTNREGDPLELIRRGITIAAAPGFMERQPDAVQELVDYRLTVPTPAEQYAAQVAAGAGMSALSEEQVVQRMATIQSPTLILFGEFDNVVPPGNAELLAEKIKGAQVHIIPGAGHIFPIEAPQDTIAAIEAFLR